VVFGEVGGAPARDGVADVLSRADDRREDDKEENGVAVVQPVDNVVVVAKVHLGDARRSADDSVHGSTAPRAHLPATRAVTARTAAMDGALAVTVTDSLSSNPMLSGPIHARSTIRWMWRYPVAWRVGPTIVTDRVK